MKNINDNNTGSSAFAGSAKQKKSPSFKWVRIAGIRAKVSPQEYEKRYGVKHVPFGSRPANVTQTLREQLAKHEQFLKDFGGLFSDLADYMQCVETFQSDYSERLEYQGVSGFSDEELKEVLASIQEFQGYSAHWAKALKPFLKMA